MACALVRRVDSTGSEKFPHPRTDPSPAFRPELIEVVLAEIFNDVGITVREEVVTVLHLDFSYSIGDFGVVANDMFNTINADDLSDLLDDLNLAFQSSSHGGGHFCHGIRGRCSTSPKRVNAIRAANQRL